MVRAPYVKPPTEKARGRPASGRRERAKGECATSLTAYRFTGRDDDAPPDTESAAAPFGRNLERPRGAGLAAADRPSPSRCHPRDQILRTTGHAREAAAARGPGDAAGDVRDEGDDEGGDRPPTPSSARALLDAPVVPYRGLLPAPPLALRRDRRRRRLLVVISSRSSSPHPRPSPLSAIERRWR